MKTLLLICLALGGIGCASIGGYLCYTRTDGWGWFLLVGFLVLLWVADIGARLTGGDE